MYEVRNDDWQILNLISIIIIVGMNGAFIFHAIILGGLDFRKLVNLTFYKIFK